jgi:hypothetical protein
MSNVHKVTFEFFMTGDMKSARMISFNTDPDTGSQSVHDIMEFDMTPVGWRFLAAQAAGYDTMINTDVAYTFRIQPTTDIGAATYVALDTIDTGKTRKLESKILRAMNVVNSENNEA